MNRKKHCGLGKQREAGVGALWGKESGRTGLGGVGRIVSKPTAGPEGEKKKTPKRRGKENGDPGGGCKSLARKEK